MNWMSYASCLRALYLLGREERVVGWHGAVSRKREVVYVQLLLQHVETGLRCRSMSAGYCFQGLWCCFNRLLVR